VGLELWLSCTQRDAVALAPKVLSLVTERHNDDWRLKDLVFSLRTYDQIMQRAPHDLLKTYLEVPAAPRIRSPMAFVFVC
jgi:hypothetical protein